MNIHILRIPDAVSARRGTQRQRFDAISRARSRAPTEPRGVRRIATIVGAEARARGARTVEPGRKHGE